MKKEVIVLLLLGVLFISPLVLAQEETQKYSGFDRFIDNVKLAFTGGENSVKVALEIREREVNSAIENALEGDNKSAERELKNAQNKLQVIQKKTSLENVDEIKTSVEEVKDKIEENNLSEEFSNYLSQEEKTQLTAELTEKTYEYCKELAKKDYNLMLQEELCNPKTAQKGLENELKDLKDIQFKSLIQLMLEIRRCVDDPGTCNCEKVDIEEKARCEKMVALAIKCEYKDDETSCEELESIKPAPGDGLARSFVPDFLLNLFSSRNDLIEYELEHSDGVPEECWNENNKPECEKYDRLKEDGLDWDEYGHYIGTQRGKIRATKGIKEPSIPSMEESIPQCFDKENNFLEEKCGKITIVWNKEGLINYIIGKEIDNIIEKFENASEQNTIDINGSLGQTKVNEIKEEMNQINNQIATITYAEGTSAGGESGKDIKNIVVEKGDSSGDDGFKTEIKTGEGGESDDGLTTEVKNYVDGDGTDENKVVVEEDNGYAPGTSGNSPGNTIDETYDDEDVSDSDLTNNVDD